MSTQTETPEVSRNCAEGKHHRCLGTVVSFSASRKRIASCGCADAACTHRPATDGDDQ